MRVAACLLLAALNALLAAAFTGIAFASETSITLKFGFGAASLAAWVATGVLATRPFIELPSVAPAIFRSWCIALPITYFVGSLDHGLLSGQEVLLGICVAGFSWLSWWVFISAKLPGIPSEKTNA
jgi:hypothetical protein